MIRFALLGLALVACRGTPSESPREAAPSPVASTEAAESAPPPPRANASSGDESPTPKQVEDLHDSVVQSHSKPVPFERSPEQFAATMTGTLACEKQKCPAGKQVCVSSPGDGKSHCADIESWVDHQIPKPKGGFPGMAGITACDSSKNCPTGSFCCLQELGAAEVQAVACHASIEECRDKVELCANAPNQCRTQGTKCVAGQCKAK